jgi:hypothetical protein
VPDECGIGDRGNVSERFDYKGGPCMVRGAIVENTNPTWPRGMGREIFKSVDTETGGAKQNLRITLLFITSTISQFLVAPQPKFCSPTPLSS